MIKNKNHFNGMQRLVELQTPYLLNYSNASNKYMDSLVLFSRNASHYANRLQSEKWHGTPQIFSARMSLTITTNFIVVTTFLVFNPAIKRVPHRWRAPVVFAMPLQKQPKSLFGLGMKKVIENVSLLCKSEKESESGVHFKDLGTYFSV